MNKSFEGGDRMAALREAAQQNAIKDAAKRGEAARVTQSQDIASGQAQRAAEEKNRPKSAAEMQQAERARKSAQLADENDTRVRELAKFNKDIGRPLSEQYTPTKEESDFKTTADKNDARFEEVAGFNRGSERPATEFKKTRRDELAEQAEGNAADRVRAVIDARNRQPGEIIGGDQEEPMVMDPTVAAEKRAALVLEAKQRALLEAESAERGQEDERLTA